jgi:thioredoxin reductase
MSISKNMAHNQLYDVIIIGGSFAGLSAALALGRSLRTVLVIDSGNPCNKAAPYAHNFITHDGCPPQEIASQARAQLITYPTVSTLSGLVEDVTPHENHFEVVTDDGLSFISKKILFATGVTDLIPNTPGFAECWGHTILHCPYCHGFENTGKRTAIIGNGDMGFELAKTIRQWCPDGLMLYTNGTSTLSPEEVFLLNNKNIKVVENEIELIEHAAGQIQSIKFKDTEPDYPEVIYTQLPFRQQCPIPEKLGINLTEKGFIFVSKCMETSIPGIFAAGDCLSLFRSIAHAVASGNKAGALINKCLIDEFFYNS